MFAAGYATKAQPWLWERVLRAQAQLEAAPTPENRAFREAALTAYFADQVAARLEEEAERDASAWRL